MEEIFDGSVLSNVCLSAVFWLKWLVKLYDILCVSELSCLSLSVLTAIFQVNLD